MDNEEKTPEENNNYHRHHRGDSFGALFLILIGIIFLFNNLGILPWQIWGTLWRFWPLFLIMIGFRMVFGRSRAGNIILFLIGLLFIALILTLAIAQTNPQMTNFMNQYVPGLFSNNHPEMMMHQDWQELGSPGPSY